MHAFSENGGVESFAQARGDPMDGAASYTSSNHFAPLWSSSGLTDHWKPTQVQPSSEREREQSLLSLMAQDEQRQPAKSNTKHTDDDRYEYMRSENYELAQALAQKDQELQAAKQATRDLAAWTLNERSRLMTEALHQRLLREDYEAILRRRDEQVVHLLASHQEAKLDHARTLVREGQMMGRPVSAESVQKINEMRAQIGMPPINQYGAVQALCSVNEGNRDGTQNYETTRDPWWTSYFDEGATAEDGERQVEMTAGWTGVTQDVFGARTLGEGGVAEDEEGAYSPPDLGGSTSIVDQVDALIAEEKGRLNGA